MAKDKVKLKWVGAPGLEQYHGQDGDRAIDLVAGESVDVSPCKAAQMAEDFPHLCVVDGKGPVKAKAAAAENAKALIARVADASDDELAEFAQDARSSVAAAARAEIAKREEAAAPEPGDAAPVE